MSASPPPDLEVLGTAALHLTAGKYFQLAAFIVLLYDHILTFSVEVERIWKQKFSGATYLFLINRYVTPLQFIIIVHAFQNPVWTKKACDKFVAFEGASTVALIAICELIMILRVYALFFRNRTIVSILLIMWLAQIAISAAGLHSGFAAPLPPGFVGCIFTGRNKLFPSLWIAPLVLDSCIFILTLWRTRKYILENTIRTPTIYILVRDGIMYYLVIFMANLMNFLLFYTASDDLKAIGASFSQLITATMISRLVLNLRSVHGSSESYGTVSSGAGPALIRKQPRKDSFMTRTIGNLGEDLDTFLDELRPSEDIAMQIQSRHTAYRD